MSIAPARDYPRLRPGARVVIQADPADPASVHRRRYLRALAQTADFGGVTIPTARPLRAGSVVRLRLYFPPAVGDPAAFGATAVVRWRRAWLGRRRMALQFLEFEGLGSRSLECCLATVLAAAGPRLGSQPVSRSPEALVLSWP